MKKQIQLKEEFKKIGMIFIIAYIFFQIHYYKESAVTVFRLVLAHFYLFLIPGYMIMLKYSKKIEFEYRLFIGLGLGYALQSLLVYFITLIFHLNLKEYYLILPLIISAIGYYIADGKENKKEEAHD